MRYIISDIHGCYEEYKELLKKISFSQEDQLFVLGDVVDRGPESMKVLQDMMEHMNVEFILGNHDFMFYSLMKKFAVEITEETTQDDYFSSDDILAYNNWIWDGGYPTAEAFKKLSREEKEDILDYISDAMIYEILEQDGKEYILVHAGLGNFSPEKELEDYDLDELLESRMDYSKSYFTDDKILVTGHTPTLAIQGWEKPEVFIGNHNIALDCGCVHGGNLAAYCIETGEVTYVKSKKAITIK